MSMNNTTLNDLTPVFFLQTFIMEIMHATEQFDQGHNQNLIEHIAQTAGCFFEEVYRSNADDKEQALTIERYIELILGLKNNIGGNFSLSSSNKDCLSVYNTRCPFGEKVVNFPEL